MTLAVLSGKGGTGKTFVSANLAALAAKACYVDCDVEEPNGRLFLKPRDLTQEEVSTLVPSFDPALCDGCRKCVDTCRFHALIYIKGTPKLFTEVCHACGACAMVCPQKAIREVKRPVGVLEKGKRGELPCLTGILNMGEASGVPVIKAAIRAGKREEGLTILDSPPGSGCAVVECVSQADQCLIVTEPTAFGFHNFRMVAELCSLLNKPFGVVLNKAEGPYGPLEDFCREQNIPILASIPYSPRLAALGAEGRLASEEDPETAKRFQSILESLGEEAGA